MGLFCDLLNRLDNKSAGGRSIASNLMKADDEVDDGDSMAAYNEGDTGMHSNIIDIYTCILAC